MESQIKKCNTNSSVLKNGALLRRNIRHQSLSNKKVMFDPNAMAKPSHFSHSRKQSDAIHKRPRHNSTRTISKRMSLENSFVEIIEANGEVKKEKIKIDGDNKEFVKNRNKKYSGEFKKAQEYYDMNKEEDKEENDNNEDTKTNTMRNQFAGKLKIIDGMGSRNKKE